MSRDSGNDEDRQPDQRQGSQSEQQGQSDEQQGSQSEQQQEQSGQQTQQSQSNQQQGQSGQQQGQSGQQQGQSNQQQSQSGQQQGQSGQQQETTTVEKAIMVISAGFTILLFAYAGWQIVTVPQAETPQVSVVETETLEDGSVAVTVMLRNPGDVGLITATVESTCTAPPTSVQFSFVPASSTRTGTLVCPPGTTDPSVSIANWRTR